ncbi:hypothetical protein ACIQ7S_19355 [Streptomyces griseoluteus]|uniref:hypothetical protein n=1 Tax=Streptomyces griseoluteus TaxID=29306 RepID=UPI00331B25A7
MRVRTVAGALVLAAVGLVGCSGQGVGAHKGDGGSRPGLPAKSIARLSLPVGYDANAGWDTTIAGVPKRVTGMPLVAVPGAGEVASIHGASNGWTTIVRAADTGRIAWTSAPWQPPLPGDTEASRTPGVVVVKQASREYLVTYAEGIRGKDALHDGSSVVALAVYAAVGHGTAVKPLRRIELPVADDPVVRVTASGDRLLVGLGDGMYPARSLAVDVVTGERTTYDGPDELLSPCVEADCAGGRVIAATARGPLIGVDNGGFGLAGHWFSDSVRPAGTERTGDLAPFNGLAYGAVDGHVLAGWQTPDKEDGTAADPVWSVHELTTGRLQASVTCGYSLHNEINAGNYGASREYDLVASPGGRYVGAGPVAFDLRLGKGLCLARSGDRRAISLVAIRDDGTAYGAVQQDAADEATPVQVDLTKGPDTAKVLKAGTLVPYVTDVRGSGLFLSRDAEKALRVSLRRER